MRIPIYNPFTGRILTSKKIKKIDKDEEEIIKIMRKKYYNKQVDFGRINWNVIKDLADGSRRKMYFSELKYKLLYGIEWKQITNEIRMRMKNKCQECNRRFESHNLNVHHIKSISKYIEEGIGINNEEHECYGIQTNKPWHVEDNLILLCQNHHADKHLHMKRRIINELTKITWTKKKEEETYKPRKVSKKEKEEQRRRIQMMIYK